MYKYEFAHIIVSEGKKDEEIQKVIGNVRQIIGELGGRIVKEDVWGQKELAYEIEKQNHGFYMFTIMMMEPDKVPEFEKRMKLVDGSMRYMIINLDREPGYEDDLNITSEKIEKDKEAKKEKDIEKKEKTEKIIEEKKEEIVEEEIKTDTGEKETDEIKEEVVEEKKPEPKEDKTEEVKEGVKKEPKEEEVKDEPKKEDKSDEDIDKLIDEKLNEIL